ncbi:MAG: hypothetical protein FJ006_04980 [Chloroflexi bacterium]|nr:hypothetical protein [Chloroflexota bacterium]
MSSELKVLEKVLKMAEKELTLEEYARFLAAITPKVGDSVAEIRDYRGKATYDEILEELKKRTKIVS